ncbi:hypothetical protein ASG43_16120 [Aureimonas sp. Leaf454]|uniref:HPP family protein n=1 Tax=Aureimonas sp. Leaf454 TaxID=1736381 RepID=UPI0006F4B606|nr:HPP family protein [Aureimonas sp. Leaf454]KQT43050.1 hypothetical protein ASG43_16120 [Aureimonas sp. Leaf454]
MQFKHWIPDLPRLSPRERIRSAAGALIGILATGLVARAAVGEGAALPVLIAPMGASAVLLFAVPASPLAQPWSILGGNLVAAFVGVTAARLVADPMLAAALAISVAIAAMIPLRCLHPPSGAVALTAVLGGPAITGLGYGFLAWPVAANSLLLLGTALLFNNLTGRTYPHVPPREAARHGTADPPPSTRVGLAAADLDAVLREFDGVLDIGRGDLLSILKLAQMRTYGRTAGRATASTIMSRDVVAIAPDASLGEALELLRRHHIKALPVTDESARVIGIVTQTDLLDKASWDGKGRPRIGLRHRLHLTMSRARAPYGSVEDIMTTPVETIRPDRPIAEIVLPMTDAGLHHLPVVGADDRLLGIVSQSDLITALLAEASERAEG